MGFGTGTPCCNCPCTNWGSPSPTFPLDFNHQFGSQPSWWVPKTTGNSSLITSVPINTWSFDGHARTDDYASNDYAASEATLNRTLGGSSFNTQIHKTIDFNIQWNFTPGLEDSPGNVAVDLAQTTISEVYLIVNIGSGFLRIGETGPGTAYLDFRAAVITDWINGFGAGNRLTPQFYWSAPRDSSTLTRTANQTAGTMTGRVLIDIGNVVEVKKFGTDCHERRLYRLRAWLNSSLVKDQEYYGWCTNGLNLANLGSTSPFELKFQQIRYQPLDSITDIGIDFVSIDVD